MTSRATSTKTAPAARKKKAKKGNVFAFSPEAGPKVFANTLRKLADLVEHRGLFEGEIDSIEVKRAGGTATRISAKFDICPPWPGDVRVNPG